MRTQIARKLWACAIGIGVLAESRSVADELMPVAPLHPLPGEYSTLKRITGYEPLAPDSPIAQVRGQQPSPTLPEGGGASGDAPPPVVENKKIPVVEGPSTGNASNTGAAQTYRTNDVSNAAPAGGPTSLTPAGQTATYLNARDLGQFLNRSAATTGVQVQNRNALVTDPRIRGMHSYQFALQGDGGIFNPVRLDLDTPITRFDAAAVRDVIVIKGPYSVMYGPGHAALDVATLDSPRFTEGFDWGGRTSLGYQTNGNRWDGLQSVWAGDKDWGVRLTYNGMQGNDYTAGNGQWVPGSYLSHNVNWAIGMNLSPNSKLEFKGLRTTQSDVEFPGLYFDVTRQDTEAYSLRYTLQNECGPLDRLVFDVWYNSTVGNGNTAGGAKQAFVQDLLAVSFNPNSFDQSAFTQFGYYPIRNLANPAPGSPPLNLFTDQSTSRFATNSLGYRLFADWGKRDTGIITTGTDLRIVGQGLQENIQFTQFTGRNINTNAPILPNQPVQYGQFQSIPDSTMTNPGLFVAGELPFTDRATFRAGGRMDWVRTTTSDRTIRGNIDLFPPSPSFNFANSTLDPLVFSSDTTNPGTDRNFYLLAGYLQGEYKLMDGLTGIASFGHSERAPTLTELYAAGPFIGVLQQGTSRLIGDPRLKPEKLTQMDIGLQVDTKRFKGGVSGFYGWVNDYITFDQVNSGAGLTQVVFTNTDLATLAGGELYAQLELSDWLTGFGTMTYVQGIDQTHSDRQRRADVGSSRRTRPETGNYASDTEPLPQIPPLDTRLGLRLHQPSVERKWQIELSTRIVSGQNSVAKSLGEVTTPGFSVWTLRGYWQATDRLLLTAGVENIGNKFYREHLDPISGNILGVNPLFRPGTNFYFGSQLTY